MCLNMYNINLKTIYKNGADIYDTTRYVDGRKSLIGLNATH